MERPVSHLMHGDHGKNEISNYQNLWSVGLGIYGMPALHPGYAVPDLSANACSAQYLQGAEGCESHGLDGMDASLLMACYSLSLMGSLQE